MSNADPAGTRFYDLRSGRVCLLSEEGWSAGWLLYRHPDGHLVTWRKATDEDLRSIGAMKEQVTL